jgi:ATP-dependent helicase/nuclease subunit A
VRKGIAAIASAITGKFADMVKNKFTLTEKQQLCASEIDKSLAILAGAGSGKTAIIIERIKNIIKSGRANFSNIVAITFTEKAAGELVYRLTEEMPVKKRAQIDQAAVTTIDGFCTNILREDAASIGINPDFDILEEHSARILIHRIVSSTLTELLDDECPEAEHILEEMEYRYAVSCLEEMVEKRWYLKSTRTSIENNREEKLRSSLIHCFNIISSRLEEEKNRLGVLDFVDLEILTLELLDQKEVKKKYQQRIKHLLIDEYQDTSDLQTEIIKKIYNPKKNILCIVGDPGQSIYRFRGANPGGIDEMRQTIEDGGGQTIELVENFRSSKPVIEFVNNLFFPSPDAEDNDNDIGNRFLPLESKAETSEKAQVATINIDANKLSAEEIRERESEKLASLILTLKDRHNCNYSDFALLFRSFTDIGIYEKALNQAQIPFYRSGGRAFLNQPEVADIILCLKALANRSDDTLNYGLARSTIVGFTDEECYKLFTGRKRSLFDIIISDKRFKFLETLSSIKDYLSISELIREVVRAANLHGVFESIQSSGQPTANIEKLIAVADSLGTEHDYTLSDFLEYVEDLKLRGIGIGEPPIFGTRDNAVKLLTVHAAKGLEFNIVILADLLRSGRSHAIPYIIDRSGTIGFKLREENNPISEREKMPLFEELAEEDKEAEELEKERLLYVATTRAKEMLIIPFFDKKSAKASWQKLLDPHLEQLGKIDLNTEVQTRKPEAAAQDIKPPFVFPPVRERILTVSHLESFNRCPQEYYLKYVLKMPSETVQPKINKMGANTIGNIVHKTIQIAARNNTSDWENIIPIIAHEYSYGETRASDIKKILKHLTNYEESSYYDAHLDGAKHETPFVFKLNNVAIKGTIDCIFKDGDGYSIVDFKTDHVEEMKDIKAKSNEYQLQIMTYALAANMALNKPIKKIGLLFLEMGRAEEIQLSEESFANGKDIICNITDSIIEGDYDISAKETPCEKCSYQHNRTCWLNKPAGNNA